MKFSILLLASCALASPAFANVSGTVILLRGNARTDSGKSLALKDPVAPGTTIKTEAKSFVKLLFADQTTMNIGPDTTLKIEDTRAGEPGLVNLVGGQIRAKVTKDLLKGDTGGEKLLIKTKTAAMGIRGTDFSVTFNEKNQNTALLTFEGEVAMAKTESGQDAASALRGEVRSVGPGQFSGAQPDQSMASVPVKISPAQLETLKGNDSFQGLGEKRTQGDSLASPIPPGVSAVAFSSGAEQFLPGATKSEGASGAAPPEGFYDAKTGSYAPRAGGFVDLNTGRYVPPPPGSSFDPNTGTYLPPKAAGQFDPATGMYVPPKGVELDAVKGFVADNKTAGSPQATALAAALNFASKPENAGKQVSFDALFSPTVSGQQPPPPPPPPPPREANLLSPPREPVDDPTCVTCIQDQIPPTPTLTNVRFNITVQ